MIDKFKTFQSHKVVQAQPMTRGEYNTLRGWDLPEDEDPADEGYLVMCPQGGGSNHPDFPHYISWSPKMVFEQGNKELQPAPEGTHAVDDLPTFVGLLTNWHEQKVAELVHFKEVPEGTEATFETLGTMTLAGDTRKGFIAGIEFSLTQLGELPFEVNQDEEKSDGPAH